MPFQLTSDDIGGGVIVSLPCLLPLDHEGGDLQLGDTLGAKVADDYAATPALRAPHLLLIVKVDTERLEFFAHLVGLVKVLRRARLLSLPHQVPDLGRLRVIRVV